MSSLHCDDVGWKILKCNDGVIAKRRLTATVLCASLIKLSAFQQTLEEVEDHEEIKDAGLDEGMSIISSWLNCTQSRCLRVSILH